MQTEQTARRPAAAVKRNKRIVFLQKGKMDLTFLFFILVLLTTGLVMLFSASAPYAEINRGNSYYFITRQLIFAVAGLVIMLGVSRINYKLYKKIAWILYAVSVGLLVLVKVLPYNVNPNAKRWIAIGGFSFQPSEIAKFAVILLFAYLIAKNYEKMKTFKFGILFLGLLLALVCGLVVIEPHLSATVLIFIIGVSMMIVGGIKARYVALGAGVAVGGFAIAMMAGAGYWAERFSSWLDPWSDPLSAGYQTIQSLLAIGSGGIMGRGLGESTQKYLWLPEPQNDFIFSIVCEELGLIGALLIITAFGLLVWRGFVIAMRTRDKFGSLLAIGLTLQVGLQAVLNILVVTNTVPNTGISLPFFSYGGTSLLMLMAQMGIILSISRQSNLQKT